MKFFKCLFILCFLRSFLFAQQNFDPGYIVEHTRDTVRGYVEIAIEADLTSSIKFKKSNEEPREYKPVDLLGFGIGQENYRSMEILNTAEDSVHETAFVKQLVTGEYNLYSYVKPNRRFYILQTDTILYFLYDRISRNTGQIDQEGNYYNYLHFISVNCEKLSNLYDRVGFNDQDMAGFVLKADNCISQTKATSYYQKPVSLIQPFLFVGGLPVSSMSQFTVGFTLRFTLPRVDKKTSFNVGIFYSNTTVESTERNDYLYKYTLVTHNQVFSVPLTFQYNFTTTRVQPYFYTGFSASFLHKTSNSLTYDIPTSSNKFGLALVAGIGVEARVASRLYVRADWRYEVILESPAFGLAYKF